MLFVEKKIYFQSDSNQYRGLFNYTSAVNLVEDLKVAEGIDLKKELWENFIRSKQTNLNDLTNSRYYFYLEWVEFLEFICRIGLTYGKQLSRTNETSGLSDI